MKYIVFPGRHNTWEIRRSEAPADIVLDCIPTEQAAHNIAFVLQSEYDKGYEDGLEE